MAGWLALVSATVFAGPQAEEHLAPSVATLLSRAVSDGPAPPGYALRSEVASWMEDMSRRLAPRIADVAERRDFLATVHYEAIRAGLDPQLVLAVIHHESGFKKYAVSVADARGYMQVMPFWTRLIGVGEHNLFHLRTNLRYGCVILRHYLDRENGDLFRALGRYNGSLGRSEYPEAVAAAMRRYDTMLAVAVPPVARVSLGAMVPAK
ncbi:MAG TPA: lytic transglycosylase domain-containing protein [Casimicrobiaceae bacterium]|nr:lytic transglycosylase domain-containing protein [Casimicrobiaceae bacterium]